MIPARPWTPAYAVARRYMEAHRMAELNRGRPRSDDYREHVARRRAAADIAVDLGVVDMSGGIHAHAMDTLREHPTAPGPEWLHAAAVDLADRLNPDAGRADRSPCPPTPQPAPSSSASSTTEASSSSPPPT